MSYWSGGILWNDRIRCIQVRWLIGEIRDLDKMIVMHRSAGSDFMAEQYKGRRLKYFQELISLLANSAYNVSGRETFPLIGHLLRENYSKRRKVPVAEGSPSFDKVLHFYERQQVGSYTAPVAQSRAVGEREAGIGRSNGANC